MKSLCSYLFLFLFSSSLLAQSVTISEINYNSEASVDAGNWVELYNYGTSAINIGGWIVKDNNNNNAYAIPANTTLQAGGRWVVVEDMTLFNAIHPTVTNKSGPLGFGLGNKSDMVRLYNGNQLIAGLTYYDSIPWPQGADGEGRTLELLNATANIDDPANWFDGCIGGSPGVAYSPCVDAIVFSEINYNSDSLYDTDDWVELRNVSNSPVDIGGWKFMDDTAGTAHTYIIPSPRVIAPHSHWVLTQTQAKFSAKNPTVSNYNGSFGFNLSGNGEWIRMYDKNNVLRLSVHYNDKAPWPLGADGDLYTLELVDSLGKMNEGSNWTTICKGGSPGRYPSQPCPPLTQISPAQMGIAQLQIAPNPADELTFLNLTLKEAAQLQLQLSDLQGRILASFPAMSLPTGSHQIEIPLNEYPAGLYHLQIIGENQQLNYKIIKQ